MSPSTPTGRAATKAADPANLHREPPMQADSTQDVGLSFESPESSSIVHGEYDPATETMTVEMKVNGARYQYSCVPSTLWREFVQAESKGQFFAQRVRPIYPGRKV